MLYRCIYASTLSPTIGDDAVFGLLSQIEEQSARNNARMKLSGILLSFDRHFMQVLEGSNRSISTLISTLCGDPRHTDMLLIELVAVERRVFPEWTMKWAPVKRRPDFAASAWNPDKLTAQAILSLAKSVRAGLRTRSEKPAANPTHAEVYLD
jgi:hypothetical protein